MADNSIDILFDLRVQENRVKRELEKANKVMQEADRRTKRYKNSVKDVINAELKLAKIRKDRIAINKQAVVSQQNLTKAQIQAKNATGGATASVLELGRAISDAPYGIRGMANNLSQLTSQLAFTTKAAGGFRAALKSMWSAMLGPLGIVIAIQSVLAIFEHLSMQTKKAERSTSDLKNEISELATAIGNDVNVNIKEYIELMREKQLLDEKIAESSNEIKEIEEKINKNIERRLELEERARKSKLDTSLLDEQIELARKREGELTNQIVEIYKNASKALADYRKKKKSLTKSSEEGMNVEMGSVAWYKKSISSLIQIRDATATTTSEYNKQTKSINRLKNELKKLTGEGKEMPKVTAMLTMPTSEEITEYNKKLIKAFEDAWGVDSSKTPLDLAPKLELGENAKAAIDKYNKELLKVATDKMAAEDWAGYADAFKQGLSLVSDFVDAQFERDLATEQNKTTAMNDELNQRLLNENLSKDERAKIQQEIWQNDDKLRKKQNEIKKKQFNANKAFQISMAVADTASSALKAYGSQLMVGNPASLISAKIAAATATAVGLAQIATIASQKFVPESASTPIRTASASGGSGGVGDRSFNFNLVGASQQNQLAQAIQGTFDKPIKAYVVSKDITNQQQLDANTKSTARFGG